MKKEFEIFPSQLALHSVKNVLGDQRQVSLFSDHHKDFSDKYDFKLEGRIDRFGIDLTDTQSRLMEGILRGFTETSFRGNVEGISKEALVQERYSGEIPPAYQNIDYIPRLRVSQFQILEWSGINRNSVASVSRALEALENLGTKQYCFYYDRLMYNKDGTPVKDVMGHWKKERVVTVDTLFTIKKVFNDTRLSYYEITPSAIFLDQRESYFMLVPFGWREEVRKLVGNKKASSYTFLFLLFLRYQYEIKRRKKEPKPYQIKWSPEEIAIAIKMPETVYKRQKKRAEEILTNAYEVAKKLGYLTSYERLGHIDILILDDQKYFTAKGIPEVKPASIQVEIKQDQTEASRLLNYFYEMRRLLDPEVKSPAGAVRDFQMLEMEGILKERKCNEVEALIKWSIEQKYWSSRLSTPAKIKKNFSEAISEMNISQRVSKNGSLEDNIKLAKKLEALFKSNSSNTKADATLEVLSKHVEIGNGVHQPICISFDEKDFPGKLKNALVKWGLVGSKLPE